MRADSWRRNAAGAYDGIMMMNPYEAPRGVSSDPRTRRIQRWRRSLIYASIAFGVFIIALLFRAMAFLSDGSILTSNNAAGEIGGVSTSALMLLAMIMVAAALPVVLLRISRARRQMLSDFIMWVAVIGLMVALAVLVLSICRHFSLV
jgi:hypothetical protein